MRYPNLELLEYIFNQHRMEVLKENITFIPDVNIQVFSQMWPNTGGGFACPGYCYGDAMTRQYTTVLYSENQNIAMVCFDNKPAYLIDDLSEEFWEDLDQRNMKPLGRSDFYGRLIWSAGWQR